MPQFRLIAGAMPILFTCGLAPCLTSHAEDWSRFRGPSGNGMVIQAAGMPDSWSPQANLAWKTALPGPGASSPIVVGGKVLVTCYSGYGLSQEDPGNLEDLVRHLVCVDAASGEKLWQKDVPASLPEDPYEGIGVTAHGYASHTPVSDGKNVYAFFGKGGVHAFDLDGNELWQAEVGKESDPARWGSSSSPVMFEDLVIVTASAESQAVIALDRESGKEVWRKEAKGLDGMWGTPTLVKVDKNRTELVMLVAKELWGMDPRTGDLLWYADATGAQQAYSSVVLDGKKVFAFTGRGGGSIAIEAGGKGDVSDTNTVWTGRDSGSFASPVRFQDKLYLVSRNVLSVVDATTGKRLEQIRLRGAKQTGGRFGSLDYASPIVVGDRLMYMNGSGQMWVFQLGEETEQIALNELTADKEIFWGSPAVSDGKLFIRSSKNLYCVTDKGQTVPQNDSLIARTDDPAAPGENGRQRGGRGNAGRGGDGGRRQRFDPITMFNGMDKDQDGLVTEKELEGNRLADRLKTLDKDGDKAISKDEFTGGIASLFQRGGGRGGRGGGSGYGGRGEDTRPDRPQRPSES
ncbi:MAG: PQQ-binding-like beta-propeller repeat protein [Planctomycetota bacterium]